MNSKTKEAANNQAEICSVFGNQLRLLALWALVDGERSVSDIAKIIGSSLQNTSQHLRLMKNKGILVSRRDGQYIYYRIAENDLINKCKIMMEAKQIKLTQD